MVKRERMSSSDEDTKMIKQEIKYTDLVQVQPAAGLGLYGANEVLIDHSNIHQDYFIEPANVPEQKFLSFSGSNYQQLSDGTIIYHTAAEPSYGSAPATVDLNTLHGIQLEQQVNFESSMLPPFEIQIDLSSKVSQISTIVNEQITTTEHVNRIFLQGCNELDGEKSFIEQGINGEGEATAKVELRQNQDGTFYIDIRDITQPKEPEDKKRKGNKSGYNGQIQLWQFLLSLLLDINKEEIISWTDSEGKFTIKDNKEVAKQWGKVKDNNDMDYSKMARALRYYYKAKFLEKVRGSKFSYKFVGDLKPLTGYSASDLQVMTETARSSHLSDNERIEYHTVIESIKTMLMTTSGSVKAMAPEAQAADELSSALKWTEENNFNATDASQVLTSNKNKGKRGKKMTIHNTQQMNNGFS